MPDLILKGVETDEELRQAHDLMARVHFLDSFEALRWLETCGVNYPSFRREHTRVAYFKGELAGALRLTTGTIRIGEARLKMGGFGWVTTAGHHRHQGIARELIQDTMRYMREQNYHLSMLFGIPNFYHRFGFTTSLAEYATIVSLVEALVAAHGPYRMRPGKPGDIPAIQKIHNADDAEVACSIVRSTAHITNQWEHWKAVRVLTNERGKVIAYFLPRTTEEELSLEEVGVADRATCGALVHACATVAEEEHVSRIRFAGPPSRMLSQYLLQYKSKHEMQVTRDSGGMIAFVNLGETLESMIPEWENLLLQNAARELRTECTLLVDRKPYRIRANRGALDIAPVSGVNKISLNSAELTHLVTGYRFLNEILETRRRLITPEGKALLAAIFPKRTPYVWRTDRF